MPQILAFDSLAASKQLREAGFSEQQAEAQVMLITRLVDDQLATKQDIAEVQRDIKMLEQATKTQIAEVKRDIKMLEQVTKTQIADAARDTIKWTAGLLIGQATLIVVLIKLL